MTGNYKICIYCNGIGKIKDKNSYATIIKEEICPYCNGKGVIFIKNIIKEGSYYEIQMY